MGLTTLSQTMTPLMIPLLVQQFVGEGQQGTFYGKIRLWSLMVAILVQALMGMLSDRSTLRFGRRRPFIFIGTLFNVIIIIAIGLSIGLDGMNGYWYLFVMVILLMVASNSAQAAAQGLIPDLIPVDMRGRFSAFKALFEVPIPLILVSFTIGRLISAGYYWPALLTTIGILLFTMLITMFAPENQFNGPTKALDWTPFIRLIGMVITFTITILFFGEIIKRTGNQLIPLLFGNQFWNQTVAILIFGVIGTAAMITTIGIGVWFSIRIGLGKISEGKSAYSWWVINRLAFLAGTTNLASFALYFLQGRLGYDNETAARPATLLFMLIGLFILILSIPSGWLTDKFGPKIIVFISGIVAAFGAIIIIISPSIELMYVGGVMVGIATGLFFPSNWSLGTELVPSTESGRYLGISNLAGAGAGAVGAYIGGPIADYFTLTYPKSPGIGYVLIFSIFGLLFVFSIYAISKVKVHLYKSTINK